MIWAILALLGVPLWLIAAALTTLVVRNRDLRRRPGNIPVRLRPPGGRWKRGHGLWVHDVFAFRGSPATWQEALEHVEDVTVRGASDDEARKLRGLDRPVIATLVTTTGTILEVGAAGDAEASLVEPFRHRPATSTAGA